MKKMANPETSNKAEFLLLCGDESVFQWFPNISKEEENLDVKIACFNKDSLKTIIAKTTVLIEKCPSKSVVVMFTLVNDLTKRCYDSSFPSNQGLVEVVKNKNMVAELASQISDANKQWQEIRPDVRVIWTLPLYFNVLNFNINLLGQYGDESMNDRETNRSIQCGKIFFHYMKDFIKLFADKYADINCIPLKNQINFEQGLQVIKKPNQYNPSKIYKNNFVLDYIVKKKYLCPPKKCVVGSGESIWTNVYELEEFLFDEDSLQNLESSDQLQQVYYDDCENNDDDDTFLSHLENNDDTSDDPCYNIIEAIYKKAAAAAAMISATKLNQTAAKVMEFMDNSLEENYDPKCQVNSNGDIPSRFGSADSHQRKKDRNGVEVIVVDDDDDADMLGTRRLLHGAAKSTASASSGIGHKTKSLSRNMVNLQHILDQVKIDGDFSVTAGMSDDGDDPLDGAADMLDQSGNKSEVPNGNGSQDVIGGDDDDDDVLLLTQRLLDCKRSLENAQLEVVKQSRNYISDPTLHPSYDDTCTRFSILPEDDADWDDFWLNSVHESAQMKLLGMAKEIIKKHRFNSFQLFENSCKEECIPFDREATIKIKKAILLQKPPKDSKLVSNSRSKRDQRDDRKIDDRKRGSSRDRKRDSSHDRKRDSSRDRDRGSSRDRDRKNDNRDDRKRGNSRDDRGDRNSSGRRSRDEGSVPTDGGNSWKDFFSNDKVGQKGNEQNAVVKLKPTSAAAAPKFMQWAKPIAGKSSSSASAVTLGNNLQKPSPKPTSAQPKPLEGVSQSGEKYVKNNDEKHEPSLKVNLSVASLLRNLGANKNKSESVPPSVKSINSGSLLGDFKAAAPSYSQTPFSYNNNNESKDYSVKHPHTDDMNQFPPSKKPRYSNDTSNALPNKDYTDHQSVTPTATSSLKKSVPEKKVKKDDDEPSFKVSLSVASLLKNIGKSVMNREPTAPVKTEPQKQPYSYPDYITYPVSCYGPNSLPAFNLPPPPPPPPPPSTPTYPHPSPVSEGNYSSVEPLPEKKMYGNITDVALHQLQGDEQTEQKKAKKMRWDNPTDPSSNKIDGHKLASYLPTPTAADPYNVVSCLKALSVIKPLLPDISTSISSLHNRAAEYIKIKMDPLRIFEDTSNLVCFKSINDRLEVIIDTKGPNYKSVYLKAVLKSIKEVVKGIDKVIFCGIDLFHVAEITDGLDSNILVSHVHRVVNDATDVKPDDVAVVKDRLEKCLFQLRTQKLEDNITIMLKKQRNL